MSRFPHLIEEGVYQTGFNSPKSYGASSYFIVHPDGNWLIDSPKYIPHLVECFKAMGGIFRPTHLHGSFKLSTSLDDDFVHSTES